MLALNRAACAAATLLLIDNSNPGTHRHSVDAPLRPRGKIRMINRRTFNLGVSALAAGTFGATNAVAQIAFANPGKGHGPAKVSCSAPVAACIT